LNHKILLVRLRQIGDVAFTTPAVAAIRRRYPDAQITYLVEPAAASIVLQNPNLDEVLVVPRQSLWRDLRLGMRLRRRRFDLAVDFHGGPRASLLTWLSGAPVRVGYDVLGRSWMYTRVVDRPRELRRRHSVVNQWDLLTALGFEPPTPSANPIEIALDPAAAAAVERRLTAAGVAPGEAVVVVHVSASSPFRRWPAPAFVETVASLAVRGRRRVVVTSGPSDRGAAERIIEAARARLAAGCAERILSCGDFSLAELRALLERSAVYIGGDSGPLHIAASTRVPIVALFGPTPSERSIPWRDGALATAAIEVDGLPCRPCDQRVCTPGDFRCLTGIEPGRVIEAAEGFLEAAP